MHNFKYFARPSITSTSFPPHQPESEYKETGNNKEVEANADKDEESEDDAELVGDDQQDDGDQAVQHLGREGGVRVLLEEGEEPED